MCHMSDTISFCHHFMVLNKYLIKGMFYIHQIFNIFSCAIKKKNVREKRNEG